MKNSLHGFRHFNRQYFNKNCLFLFKNRRMRYWLFGVLSCFIFSFVGAQNIKPKAGFHVNFGLPINLQNESFNGIMQGLLNTSAHFQYTLENALCFGIGVNYSYFTLNEFKISEANKGAILMPSGFVKVGHEKFHSSNFGTDIGLKMGYTMNLFKSDSIVINEGKLRQVGSLYFEPNAGVMLTIDDRTTIKFAVGYVIQDFGFQPTMIGLSSNAGYDPLKFKTRTQYITIGFGYTHYFKSKR